MMIRWTRLALALALAATLAACGDDDDGGGDGATDETEETEETGDETTTSSTASNTTATDGGEGASAASVSFTAPEDGSTVTSPVAVTMAATNFTIEPAGDGTVTDGHGHFHIMIDAECVAPGDVVPSDADHMHFGAGQTETELNLTAGEHTLCLQPGDGAHTALDLTDEISITVE